jgi:hypothetical protein
VLPNSRSRDIASTSPWTKEPTIKELTGLFLLSGSIFVLFICLFQSYPSKVDNFGDNLSYMEVASAIRHWSFKGLVIEHFWGLPYLMASVSIATRMSDRAALLVICVLSSFASVLLARRMWGGWVAGLFAVLNLDWIQRSLLGGSEPLFTALIFGSFLAVRRGRWMLATVLASLATICRPLGFIGLLAIAVSLLWKREPLKCLLATAMGLAIGVLYALPLALYFGSPLANIHGYDPDGSLFGIPFHAVIVGTMRYPAPLSNLILTCGWIVFVLGGTAAMATNQDYRVFPGLSYRHCHSFCWLCCVGYLKTDVYCGYLPSSRPFLLQHRHLEFTLS